MIELIKDDGTKVGELKNVVAPLVEEVINGKYDFAFTTHIDENLQYIDSKHGVRVEGQRFDFVKRSKVRAEMPSIAVECDHISYRLASDSYKVYTEEYEDTPASILEELLENTPFEVGQVEFQSVVYFRPQAESVRGRILELANYLGGEMLWDNWTVNMLIRRGTYDGAAFVVGENIRGIREDVTYVNGVADMALEVDIVDIAQLPLYKDDPGFTRIRSAELGDTVEVIDPQLAIHEMQRIVRRVYNPLDKVLPQISIGRVIRDLIDYFRDKEEAEEKEDEQKQDVLLSFSGSGALSLSLSSERMTFEAAFSGRGGLSVNSPEKPDTEKQSWLEKWEVGSTDLLAVKGIDFTSAYQKNEVPEYPVAYAGKQNEKVTIQLADNVLEEFEVNVAVGKNEYTNANFIGGQLTVEGDFPDDITVYISEGPPTPETIVKAYGVNVLVKAQEYDGYDGLWLEFGKAPLAAISQFNFSKYDGYEEVVSATYGVVGDVGLSRSINIVLGEVTKKGKVTGIKAMGNWGTGQAPPVQVSIIAVCRAEVDEDGD